jgi:RNA-directed DNA polymerase
MLIDLTGWVRRRLRAALWRQWKTARRRRRMLIRLGVRGVLATATADSGRGPWPLAHTKALTIALSNEFFRARGFPSLYGSC